MYYPSGLYLHLVLGVAPLLVHRINGILFGLAVLYLAILHYNMINIRLS